MSEQKLYKATYSDIPRKIVGQEIQIPIEQTAYVSAPDDMLAKVVAKAYGSEWRVLNIEEVQHFLPEITYDDVIK